ncbi:ParB N-terminal domain-containing protein [Stenotrophomonas sp. GD03993]|uniref:ParB N-terminal domain-containing protein n=1 Tax=unclassified Stenotrophomonas TaxID=196198 RepID=UPI002449C989|nr:MULTISPECIES: ParB N-terminal domain-containing protein [unclassified Stenotrophomonas]MDH0190263.1 ParB N-terminal domain-containing protein [Stenotrophomonas sp. GD04051]MDH0465334.1 ParB N-terminal domain-containing protein [Stenotrophomonas sp. GD03993]MDH0877821.1 ParB N-terminal domain-containing protein [Stenotrophomonas sp. GD03877]
MIETVLAPTTATVPFSQLVVSPKNVRPEPGNVDALAASIRTLGLLQNLVVSANAEGYYQVHAGGRRFEALGQLFAEGHLTADFAVPVTIIPAEEATAASLSENVQREEMHPADELMAYQAMEREGLSLDRIAEVFKVTVNYVERRLRMSEAAPELFELFRADQISASQLIGLCATDDHAVQLAVWNSLPAHYRTERELRAAVLAQDVESATDHRVAFLGGIESYIAAGGQCRVDLFSQDGQGAILSTPAILDVLVKERLEAMRSDLLAEGWGWVDLWDQVDHTELRRLGQLPASVTEEAEQEIERLRGVQEAAEAERDALYDTAEIEERQLTESEDNRDTELQEQLQQLASEIRATKEAGAYYSDEAKASAGVVLYLTRHGLTVSRGRVRPADREEAAQALPDGGSIQGGRESEVGGRKSDSIPDALRRSLLGHRNLGVQVAASQNVRVMKVLQACWAVQSLRREVGCSTGDSCAPTNLSISCNGGGTRTGYPIGDEAGKEASSAFEEAGKFLVKELPNSEAKLWDALMAMDDDELDAIIAINVARSISLHEQHKGLTAKLIEALGFDMADYFTATAENYLSRVPKSLIVEALTEAKKVKGAADAAGLAAMKKAALADEAETRLAGSGWVPKGIRTPKPKKRKGNLQAVAAQPEQEPVECTLAEAA